MFKRLKRLLRGRVASRRSVDLPSIEREQIAPFLTVSEGLPQVDWGMAEIWIERTADRDASTSQSLRRAVAAAWLDELRDAMPTDSRRWRRGAVEGLAPLEGSVGLRAANAADLSLDVIGRALREIRGDPVMHPIPPIAVVVLASAEEYYSFISHFYGEEGEYATSGGIYVRSSADTFPLLAVNGQTPEHLEATIAHELTHHALHPPTVAAAHDAGLPLWAEEGLTQLMEERVTGIANFRFDREFLARHRSLWDEIGFDGFTDGSIFHSPEGERQELSYNLAHALTNSLLTTKAKAFFAFARACRNEGANAEDAAHEHLGGSVEDLARALLWGGGDRKRRTNETGEFIDP